MQWIERLPWPVARELLRLMRVDRPVGTWLLLWPALWALAAASRRTPVGWELWLIILVGAFVMRSAGCVANDLADRNLDPLVTRTKNRPLAAGRISVRIAVWWLLFLLGIAGWLAWQLPLLALQMAPAGALLAIAYPFTKRYVHFPQFFMGAAFGWGVIIAWAAAASQLPLESWLLFAATLTWAAGYDTIYAMMDRDDDRKAGIHSTAILFGRYDIAITALLYETTLALLAWVGWRLGLNEWFYLSLVAGQIHMGWQLFSIRHYEPASLFKAFLSNQWLGLVVLGGFLAP